MNSGYPILSRQTILVYIVLVSLIGGLIIITGVSVAENETVNVDERLQDEGNKTEVILRLPALNNTNMSSSELKNKTAVKQAPIKQRLNRTDGVNVEQSFWIVNAILVSVDTNQTSLAEISSIEGVQKIEDNPEFDVPEPVPVATTQTEIQSGDYTYGLKQINAPEVWNEIGVRGEDIRVVVSDTGVDADHPDIELSEKKRMERLCQ